MHTHPIIHMANAEIQLFTAEKVRDSKNMTHCLPDTRMNLILSSPPFYLKG